MPTQTAACQNLKDGCLTLSPSQKGLPTDLCHLMILFYLLSSFRPKNVHPSCPNFIDNYSFQKAHMPEFLIPSLLNFFAGLDLIAIQKLSECIVYCIKFAPFHAHICLYLFNNWNNILAK